MERFNRSWVLTAFSLLALGMYTLFFTYPMLSGAFYSFTNWKGLTNNFDLIGIENYSKYFTDARALSATSFSLVYTSLLVLLTNIFALFLAVVISNKSLNSSQKTFFRSIYFFPAVLSLIVVGLIWNQIFYRAIPILGDVLKVEILKNNVLASKTTAMYGVLVVNLWQGVAIPFVMLTAAIQTVPTDLYECAYLEGIGSFQKFWKITFPFLIPTFNVTMVLSVRNGLTVFDYIKVLTNGGPAGSTESIGMFIYDQGISSLKYGYATAVSMILMVIIGLVSFLLMKSFSRFEVGQL